MKLIRTSVTSVRQLAMNLIVGVLVYCLLCVLYFDYTTRHAMIILVNNKTCYVFENEEAYNLTKLAGYQCKFIKNHWQRFRLEIGVLTPPWQIEVKKWAIVTQISDK